MDIEASEDDSKDYLLDPELWLDKLPQPFQMIDEVLEELVGEVWELIEHREVIRRQEEAQVKIPDITGGQLVSESQEATVMTSSKKGGPVYLSSSTGLAVLEQCSDSCDGEWRREVFHECEGVAAGLTLGESKSVSLVAVTFKQSVKVFAYTKKQLIQLTEISFSDEQDVPPEITNITIPSTWTHMTISTSHPDEGARLQLYRLPLSSWHSELEAYLKEGEESQSRVNVSSKDSRQQKELSTVALLYTLQPPSSLSPSSATDPASGMQRVQEDSTPTSVIPTGDLHILSELYLSNRRKAFVSQRADFVEESRDTPSYANSVPSCHYLFHKDHYKQDEPCQIAVWWENHNQLFVYPIPDNPSKLHPPLLRLLPQTTAIVSSAIDEEGLYLALALANGVVILWNMRTVMCTKLVRAVKSSDRVTVMAFSAGGDYLVVGSETGRVVVISIKSQDQTSTSLQHRVNLQRSVYPHLFQHDDHSVESRVVDLIFEPLSLPSVVVSVHVSGAVVLWSLTECEALCKIDHSQYPSLGKQQSCTLNKKCLLIISESTVETSSGGSTGVYAFDLHTTPTLTPHWSTHSTPSHATEPSMIGCGMTSSIESYLSHYTKTRHAQFEANREKWQKRWTELPQVLSRLSIATQ